MTEAGNQTAAGNPFRLLKQQYESALREEALYEYGGRVSLRPAIRHQ
jgi:hypothetical protein